MGNDENPQKNTTGRPLLAALAALFGVQSERNRRRDFSGRDATNYILAFAALVAVLVIAMIILVNTLVD